MSESLVAPGQVLSSSDPEPPVGTWVRDKYGDLWERRGADDDGPRPRNWSPREPDGSFVNADPETWTRVAGNQGPVTVTQAGRSPEVGDERV